MAPEIGSTLAERELVITRLFDAPRDLVWQAWTDPVHMAAWWGPHGFTNPVCEVDLRVGGALHMVMRWPDGSMEFPMDAVFQEVAPPERLVFSQVARDQQGTALLEGVTSVTFAESAGKTILTVQAKAKALVPAANAMLEGMEAGWTQSIEKLEAHLSEHAGA